MPHSADALKTIRRMLRADDGREKSFVLISFDFEEVDAIDAEVVAGRDVLTRYTISFGGLNDAVGFALLRGTAAHAEGADAYAGSSFTFKEPLDGKDH